MLSSWRRNEESYTFMKIGNREFDVEKHTYIIGILNITPDSFSDGGRWNAPDRAAAHAKEMIQQGVDILDIGGESTRPGHIQVSEEEEIQRVVPIIRAVKQQFDIPVSIDTYKANVAKAAIEAGADMVNDIWGLKYDPNMAKLIAETNTACCLMHNRKEAVYENFLQDVCDDMQQTIALARQAGIPENKIVLDPGIGFGKTLQHNLVMTKHMDCLAKFGYPLLLGTSRKSMIGLTLNLPVEQREEGTLVTTVMAVMKGYAFVRVHDVEANRRAIQMTEAILLSDR